MLDLTNFLGHGAVYRASDPEQAILRGLLAAYSEDALESLEQELNVFVVAGVMTERVQALLAAGCNPALRPSKTVLS